ncbi:hypothetical protein EVAR_67000_1 [Eumeta japonica]|uniref:Uncharacterized protein n=1 Tax=Eumeta variegata TaxID=151549 RepID=A0A4C1ZPL7_EUMVA|nr:hypothetical protein EVAR_67000_1 [Eumeta japonica]
MSDFQGLMMEPEGSDDGASKLPAPLSDPESQSWSKMYPREYQQVQTWLELVLYRWKNESSINRNQIAQIIHDFEVTLKEGIEDTAQENILEEVGDISDCESIHSEHNSASEIESDDSSDTESAEDTSSNSFTVKLVQMEQNSTTSISYSTAQHHRNQKTRNHRIL